MCFASCRFQDLQSLVQLVWTVSLSVVSTVYYFLPSFSVVGRGVHGDGDTKCRVGGVLDLSRCESRSCHFEPILTHFGSS